MQRSKPLWLVPNLVVLSPFTLVRADDDAKPTNKPREPESEIQEAAALRHKLVQTTYLHNVERAHREWQANRIDWARHYLEECPEKLRHWEWRYGNKLCYAEVRSYGAGPPVSCVAFSPDGKRLLIGSAFHERGG